MATLPRVGRREATSNFFYYIYIYIYRAVYRMVYRSVYSTIPYRANVKTPVRYDILILGSHNTICH